MLWIISMTELSGERDKVAASAMQHRLALFSYDDHFKSVDGLLLRDGD